jgi:alkylation response protein AidB-like acyl-CoA dehydrogenase
MPGEVSGASGLEPGANKEFITNSGVDITRLVTVTAVTGQRQRKDGSIKKEISTILVPTSTPGFTAEKAYNKVGWNASDTHPLTLKDVRVPEENLLGRRGAATQTSCRFWMRAGSPLPPWPRERRRAAWTNR